MTTFIINSKGEKEPFSFHKVYRSAKRVGASVDLAKEIAGEVEKEVYPGTKTGEIFKKIKKLLSKKHPRASIRFSLKEAMRKLGPTGFPFEKFIREVLLADGSKVKINQYLRGFCPVTYEIDFLYEKEKIIYIGECKYHHLAGERVDLQVTLANYARFLDIEANSYFRKLKSKGFQIKPILVTNAKFSKEAIKYAKCKKAELLGWRYPEKQGLEYLIEKEKLYPITILPSLKGCLKEVFAQKRMMLVKDLLEADLSVLSKKLNLSQKVLFPLIKEAKILLD